MRTRVLEPAGSGIAMATAGPGVTNCVTAMANAMLERVPVLLIGGCAPVRRTISGRCKASTRRHHAAGHALRAHAARRRQRAARPRQGVARDGDGGGNAAGPCTSKFPPTCCATVVPPRSSLDEYLRRSAAAHPPDAAGRARAAQIIARRRRPLVITGRGAPGQCRARALLDAAARVYPRHAGKPRPRARRARVRTSGRARPRDAGSRSRHVVGRKLDYQTGYGSPAVFRRRDRSASATTRRSCARTARRGRAVRRIRRSRWRRLPMRCRHGRRLDTAWTAACAASTCAARRSTPNRSALTRRQGRPHASEPDLRGAASAC
jgi:hypothetical protein